MGLIVHTCFISTSTQHVMCPILNGNALNLLNPHVHTCTLPLRLFFFVADSQSQISVTSTMKVVLIGKLQ